MRKYIVKIGILGSILMTSAWAISAQTTCPENLVCITREAAIKALVDSDRVIALQAELVARDAAESKLKDALNDIRVEFARVSGEATILKQRAISDAAMIELLAKLVRPKKFGIINF